MPGGAPWLNGKKAAYKLPRPNFPILGQHVMPNLPAGKVGFRPGLILWRVWTRFLFITIIE